jgi:hypothetical protein
MMEKQDKKIPLRLPASISRMAYVHHDPVPPLQTYETAKALFDGMIEEAKGG